MCGCTTVVFWVFVVNISLDLVPSLAGCEATKDTFDPTEVNLCTKAPANAGAFYFFSHTNKSTNQPPLPGTILYSAPFQGGVFIV